MDSPPLTTAGHRARVVADGFPRTGGVMTHKQQAAKTVAGIPGSSKRTPSPGRTARTRSKPSTTADGGGIASDRSLAAAAG
jgi:hypothetical protein